MRWSKISRALIELLFDNNKRFLFLANLGFYKNMPDEEYLAKRFYARMGRKLNLEKPISFNEKLQWLKLYDRKPIYTQMVDKYEAKKYVSSLIGKEYIIPTLGVWSRFDDINFDLLPEQFVLKCTHDSGGLVIVKDKEPLNVKNARKKINRSLKSQYYYRGREWPYKDVTPRIIAEAYMKEDEKEGLTDYKFYCFDGEPKYLYVSVGLENHATARISFLNMDWSFAEFKRSDYLPLEELPPKPEKYEEMIEIARRLSKGISFLRVDLYEINGQIYFGELTFTPCSGMMPFDPIEADIEVGKLLTLPERTRD